MQNPNLSVQPSPIVAIENGTATALSTDVAKFFGKQHFNVIRDIEKLIEDTKDCSQVSDFSKKLNFEVLEISLPSNLGNGSFIKSKAYRMTRDGFTLLAMSWTGKKALQFKLLWLDKFNEMEALIAKGVTSSVAPERKPYKFTSIAKLRADLLNAQMNLGITRDEIGRQCGVGEASISCFLRNVYRPSSGTLEKLTNWLSSVEVPTSYYFTSFRKLRSDILAVKIERRLAGEEIGRQCGLPSRATVNKFLRGGSHQEIKPITASKIIAWLGKTIQQGPALVIETHEPEPVIESAKAADETDETIDKVLKAAPAPAVESPKPEPVIESTAQRDKARAEALQAWLDFQMAFVSVGASFPPAAFIPARKLNSYFTGVKDEEEENAWK